MIRQLSQDNLECSRLYDGQNEQTTLVRKKKYKLYFITIAISVILVLIIIIAQRPNDKYEILQNQIPIFQKPVKENPKFVATFIPTSSFLGLPPTFPTPGHITKNDKLCLDTTKLQRALNRDIMAYEARQKYVCIDVYQKFDDYFDRSIYLMTAFNFFFEYCFDPNPFIGIIKESIQQRNKDRSNMQWALKNFKQGDNVLVIGSQNVLSFILLAKIIGNSGSLTLVGQFSLQENTCLKKNINLHKLHNVRVIRKLEGKDKYKGFSLILAKQELVQQQLMLAQFMNNSLIKSFIWVNDSSYLNQYQDCCIITKYTFDADSCNEPQLTKQIYGPGYYQIANKNNNRPYNTQLIQYTEDSFFTPFFRRYNIIKQQKVQALRKRLSSVVKIRSECGCVNISGVQKIDNFSVSIYGQLLFGVDDNQVKVWGQQRQAVEWVRQKMEPAAVIYYELRDLNLLAIMQITRIINQGKLLIFCQKFDCQWIDRQSFLSNISNIQLVTIESYDSAIASDAIITDNQQLIERAINDNYLSKGKLLGYFTRERQSSFKTFGKLLPTHNFKQIQLFNVSQQCYGFKYTHYFWDIDYLNHFYQIQPTKYHIFMYWSVSPLTLSVNRKNSIEQIIQTSKVQIKVFTRDLFYMVEGIVPIHQAFSYLSDVHQSDYFRIYMMHSFGGGYADIKHNHYDWRPYFEKLYGNPDKYAMGYRERQLHHVACHEDIRLNSCKLIMLNFTKIIGNGAYIFKKNTILTQKAISMNHQTLDLKLEELKKHPANGPRDQVDKITIKNGILYKSCYPIRWAELGGQVMSRVTFANLKYYLYDLPYFIPAIYQ